MENLKHPWMITHEQTTRHAAFNEHTGIITNGEQFLFFRTDHYDNCMVFDSLAAFLNANPILEYRWTPDNDSRLLAILNDEQSDIEARRTASKKHRETVNESWFIPRVIKRARWITLFDTSKDEQAVQKAIIKRTGDIMRVTASMPREEKEQYLLTQILLALKKVNGYIITEDGKTVISEHEQDGSVVLCKNNNGFLFTYALPADYDLVTDECYESVLAICTLFNNDPAPDGRSGPRYIKAIIARLKERGLKSIYFKGSTFDRDEDCPSLMETGTIVTDIRLSEDDEKITICVYNPNADKEPGKEIIEKDFDGTETEDFKGLFETLYDYDKGDEDPLPGEWLKMNNL